jgi:hypothetical protein
MLAHRPNKGPDVLCAWFGCTNPFDTSKTKDIGDRFLILEAPLWSWTHRTYTKQVCVHMCICVFVYAFMHVLISVYVYVCVSGGVVVAGWSIKPFINVLYHMHFNIHPSSPTPHPSTSHHQPPTPQAPTTIPSTPIIHQAPHTTHHPIPNAHEPY